MCLYKSIMMLKRTCSDSLNQVTPVLFYLNDSTNILLWTKISSIIMSKMGSMSCFTEQQKAHGAIYKITQT